MKEKGFSKSAQEKKCNVNNPALETDEFKVNRLVS